MCGPRACPALGLGRSEDVVKRREPRVGRAQICVARTHSVAGRGARIADDVIAITELSQRGEPRIAVANGDASGGAEHGLRIGHAVGRAIEEAPSREVEIGIGVERDGIHAASVRG